jgi:inositol-1,4,5-trisphosphate 5-phosphatase
MIFFLMLLTCLVMQKNRVIGMVLAVTQTTAQSPCVRRVALQSSRTQTIRKEKFPREFFPETKWSRKGFTQTRWSINGFIFDMVNVHLFHDASNLLAVEQSPSIYSKFRKNALEHTLQSLPLHPSDMPVPYVIFGDFNFRLDAHRLLEDIAKKRFCSIDKIKQGDGNEICKIIIKTAQNKTKLTIEKKEFNLHDDHDSFFSTDSQQFHKFDFEMSAFGDQLFEYEKTFPPSYPYSEEHDEARSYLRARCPAWCDRILLSHSFNNLVDTEVSKL